MGGFHVARGTTTTKQAAKRWAAMRLLQQLKHVISPAFYNDTPEGWSALRRLVTLMTAEDFVVPIAHLLLTHCMCVV